MPTNFDKAVDILLNRYDETTMYEPHGKVYPTKQARNRAKERRRRARTFIARPFVAWDGEGVTREDGVHVYTLLANSLGGYIRATPERPLTTKQCFGFILNVAARTPGANHIWYAFNYDVNMMLGDASEEDLRLLHSRNGRYTYLPSIHTHVEYRAKKSLAIRTRMTNQHGDIDIKRVTMFDVFTYFGTSFVKACDEYLGPDWPDRELVIAGKQERSTGFDTTDVLRYNKAELVAMCLLMDELRARLDYVNIHPQRWHGPGSIATSLLTQNGTAKHLALPPEKVELPLRHSYAGGRFELFRHGSTELPTWRYDRRSAYPYALAQLPPGIGKWEHHYKVVPPINPLTLYRVHWKSKAYHYVQPFHYRSPGNNVCYPPEVIGWYWGDEVAQAQRLPYGELRLLESFSFHPESPDERPFMFLRDMYDERARLRAMNPPHPAQQALKLGINSVYGKMIQQLGWKPNPDGSGEPPAYFSLFHASKVTSITRAALLQLVIDNEAYDDLISFETDAIFSVSRLPQVDIGAELGQWEETELHNLVYIQSGVYACDEVPHVRGMTKIVWPDNPGERFRQLLADRWNPYTFELEQFITMGAALHTGMNRWRRWEKTTKHISAPEPRLGLLKRNHEILLCPCNDDDAHQVNIWHLTRTYPRVYGDCMSRAYDLDWAGVARETWDPSEGADWD